MLIVCCRLLALLPLSVLRALGSAAGFVVWAYSSALRHRVASHLAQAQLALPVRRVMQATGRGAADMVWVWFTPAEQVFKRCHVKDDLIHSAIQSHQATLLLTPHLGCFEAMAKWIAAQTALTAMYRRPDKPWLAALLDEARSTPNLSMATADAAGVRLALKTLKRSGLLGILPDQVPRHGEGVWLPWFGKNAYTITLPAKLQQASQAHVFIVAALPCDDGWELVCDSVPCPAGASAEQLSGLLNQALERTVLRAPLHYAWGYKRYKGGDAHGRST